MGLMKVLAGTEKLDSEEAPANVWPICPHCKEELHKIWVRTCGLGIIESMRFLFCPHCRSFPGYGAINCS